jgi:hypothetical protein
LVLDAIGSFRRPGSVTRSHFSTHQVSMRTEDYPSREGTHVQFRMPVFQRRFLPLAAPADSSEPVVASRASTFSLGAGPSSSSPALSASSAPSSALPDPDRHKPMSKLPGLLRLLIQIDTSPRSSFRFFAPSNPDRHKPMSKLPGLLRLLIQIDTSPRSSFRFFAPSDPDRHKLKFKFSGRAHARSAGNIYSS